MGARPLALGGYEPAGQSADDRGVHLGAALSIITAADRHCRSDKLARPCTYVGTPTTAPPK
jgi:hypothetical protein